MAEAFITRRGGGNIIQWEIITASSETKTLYHTLPDISHAYGSSTAAYTGNIEYILGFADKNATRSLGSYMSVSALTVGYGADGSIYCSNAGTQNIKFRAPFNVLCLYDESEGSLV